jgi:hypothetical protein
MAIVAVSLWAAGEPKLRQMVSWFELHRRQDSRRPAGAKGREPSRTFRRFRETRRSLDLRRLRFEQAVRLDDAVIERLRYAADPALRRIAIEAKINRAGSLIFLGKLKQSFADWDELIPMNDSASAEAVDQAEAGGDEEYVEKLIAADLWKRAGAHK